MFQNMIRAPKEFEELLRQCAEEEKMAELQASSSIVGSPVQFASEWYKAEDIHRAILSNVNGGLDERMSVPEDVYSLDFAVFLAEQYRLAMIKGATLAIEEMRRQDG